MWTDEDKKQLYNRSHHPPSTLKAAPFVADDRGLATNATSAATSSGVANRLMSEDGRVFSKNSFSTCVGVTDWSFAKP